MISKYGIYPKKEDKLLVAKQAVALHPELRVATAAVDCERLFDPHTRSGPLEWRLKTIRSARARELKEQAVTLTAAPSPTSSTDDMMEGKDLYEAKNQILLSNTVEDKSVIVEASRDTAVQRHDYIAHNPTADLQALFPRYFDFVPHLVCVDFDVLYPNAKSLSKWWEPRSKIVRYLFKRTAEKSLKNFASQHLLDWNTEAQNILKLLLLAKPPKLGLAEGPLAVFGEFLRFKDESIPFDRWSDEVIEREKNQKAPPLIVAEGVSKSKINRYLVLVDGIKLPQVSDIITALDLYFKSFFVFNIGYPETVKQFLKFLQVYVYEILRSDLRHCTLKTKCLANDIELAFGDLEKEPSQDPLIIE
ncbi:unnamed protein product [Bemisia tabaci]|uniref:Uncharacterized protein n=1 Tax=Bemisia tabaci TaxID=7038 RepID=A0A9P0EYL7_BEMTA|nr:unnamed protein product [Bemisia tabaci]